MNQFSKESDHQSWENFANEFFEDDAIISLMIYLDDGPKRFSEFHIGNVYFKE